MKVVHPAPLCGHRWVLALPISGAAGGWEDGVQLSGLASGLLAFIKSTDPVHFSHKVQ